MALSPRPSPVDLHLQAQSLASAAPALLARAQDLARTVIIGSHGRKRAGTGEDFWQYRQAQAGDPARAIDWRRSAKFDLSFVQDKEWQIAQTVQLWVDPAASLHYASLPALPTKAERARLLGLALMIGLARGGERTGLAGKALPARRGMGHLGHMAALLTHAKAQADYGTPDLSGMAPRAKQVLISDFLGGMAALEDALSHAVGQGAKGVLLQVLDPAETSFPFKGRTIFESIGVTQLGTGLRHETLEAADLRQAYLERLAERQDHLSRLALQAGWHFRTHVTDQPPAPALMALHDALGMA